MNYTLHKKYNPFSALVSVKRNQQPYPIFGDLYKFTHFSLILVTRRKKAAPTHCLDIIFLGAKLFSQISLIIYLMFILVLLPLFFKRFFFQFFIRFFRPSL